MKQQIVNDQWLRRQYDKLKSADYAANPERVQHYIDKIATRGYRVGRTPRGDFQLFMQQQVTPQHPPQPAQQAAQPAQVAQAAQHQSGIAGQRQPQFQRGYGNQDGQQRYVYYGNNINPPKGVPMTPGTYRTQIVQKPKQAAAAGAMPAKDDEELQKAIAASLRFEEDKRSSRSNAPSSSKHSRQASRTSVRSSGLNSPKNTDDKPNDAHIRLAIEASLKSIEEEQKRAEKEVLKSKKDNKERHSAPAPASMSKARKSSSRSSKSSSHSTISLKSKPKSQSSSRDKVSKSSSKEKKSRESRNKKQPKPKVEPVPVPEPDILSDDFGSDDDASDLCVICDDNKRTHMCYPCGHKTLCLDCVTSCRDDLKKCPLCRKEIKDIIKVFD